jgi:hypothetical protein
VKSIALKDLRHCRRRLSAVNAFSTAGDAARLTGARRDENLFRLTVADAFTTKTKTTDHIRIGRLVN